MESVNDNSEQALLAMVASGNELAFLKLFNLHKSKVYSVLLTITRSPECAEELLQDVFIIIWKRREYLLRINSFESYLFIIARNKSYKALKKAAMERKKAAFLRPEELHHNDTMESIFASEYQQLLHQAVNGLSPQQKQVYQLVKIEGLSREESARVMHIHPETVKAHLAKAVKSIRAYCKASFRLFFIF